ncbi:MAG: DUF3467 domain-containing protein [Candidatus Kapabacteria bacterium]|nr:DUF3467 domain-containing protein [Candidatus Kapabacteria bacterium]MBX7155289.1 DUF3467 domain-containing protein [Bacteroidota bacterium]
MNNNEPQQPQQINIELGEKEAEGIYSNLAIISHSPAEFIMDFTRILPGVPKARVLSRIVMTPQHAKLLLAALNDNIIRYEQQYGEIIVNDGAMMPPVEGQKFH